MSTVILKIEIGATLSVTLIALSVFFAALYVLRPGK